MKESAVVYLMRVWAKDQPVGTEVADVRVHGTRLSATGVAIGTDPLPYHLAYRLSTRDRYVTARLLVRTEGQGWRRMLDLRRAVSGRWTCRTASEGAPNLPMPGGDLAPLAGALDCDLSLSPLTNSLPVLRHDLHKADGSVELLMAWVSVPDLAVYPSRQRYTFAGQEPRGSVVRFESLDGPFAADIYFDTHGVVLDYPGIARSVV